jgi:outer membrane protein TolC
VRRAERNLAAQSAQIGVATADLYPRLAVNGTIGVQAAELKDLFAHNSWFGSIGPSLTWNILHYGRLLNNIRTQDARFGQLAAAYQNAVLQANLEAENALVAFLRAQERSSHLADSARAAGQAAGVLVTQLLGGARVEYSIVFTTQNFNVQQQDLAAQARGDIALNLIQLYRALGGGWQIREGQCGAAPGDTRPGPEVPPRPVELLPPREVPNEPGS